MVATCRECGKKLPKPKGARGRVREFCDGACRMAAYRKRGGGKQYLTNQEAEATIKLLRKQLARQQVLLGKQAAQIPEPMKQVSFPVEIEGGRWLKITSTTSLTPGTIIKCLSYEHSDVILSKEGRVLITQDLQDGTIGQLNMHDAKANWKRHSRIRRGDLVKHWQATQHLIDAKDAQKKINSLQAEVLRLAKRVQDLAQPNLSMAIVIEKAVGKGRSGYIARTVGGNEWDQGKTPKEAFGALVFSFAVSRPVTVESVALTD